MKDQKVKLKINGVDNDFKKKLEQVARKMKMTTSDLAELWLTERLQMMGV